MADSREKQSVCKLFCDRMRREGRYDQYKAVLEAVVAETGQQHGQAKWEAMRRMGYTGPDDERRLHAEWLATQQSAATEVAQKAQIEDQSDFEAALNQLPTVADPQVEIAWIRAHPAMARKARQKDQDERVIVTADDVLHAAHGPAPSRSAAIALQNWADNPTEFNRQLAAHVKRTDGADGANGGVVEDLGLEEAERMVRDFNRNFWRECVRDAAKLLTRNGFTVTPPAGEVTEIKTTDGLIKLHGPESLAAIVLAS